MANKTDPKTSPKKTAAKPALSATQTVKRRKDMIRTAMTNGNAWTKLQRWASAVKESADSDEETDIKAIRNMPNPNQDRA